MTITYLDHPADDLAHQQLLTVAHPDWSDHHKSRVLTAFAASSFAATAWDNKTLVGTIRVFSDNVGFAMIADLLVHPKYRRQGIGGQLLKMAQQVFATYYLYADFQDETLSNFYTTAGFSEHTVFRQIPKR